MKTEFEIRPYHGYWLWTLEGSRDDGKAIDYALATVWATSSDEHGDQNVNWEVMHHWSPIARGHARNVRDAQKDAAKALRNAIK